MKTAYEYGQECYHVPPDEREAYVNVLLSEERAETAARQKVIEMSMQVDLLKERELNAELMSKGNPSYEDSRSTMIRGVVLAGVLLVPLAAETAIGVWTLKYFNLTPVEALAVASGIAVITLEGFEHYMAAFRKRFPEHENILFLTLGALSVVCLFLTLLFFADIRNVLLSATSSLNSDTSVEGTISRAETFHKNTSSSFMWLMASLTMSLSVVSGVSYHMAKSLVFYSFPLLRLHRHLRDARARVSAAGRELAALGTSEARFRADLERGFRAEQRMQTLKEKKLGEREEAMTASKKSFDWLWPALLLPIMLLAAALALFIAFRGQAHASESILLLDTSLSVSAKDYSGKTEFQKNVAAVEDILRNLSPGDSVKVAAITEASFSKPYVLIDAKIGTEKGTFGEVIAKQKMAILRQWKSLNISPNAKATDIFGAISLSAILFSQDKNKRLLIFSDMRHCTSGIDMEEPDRINAQKTFADAKKLGLPDLEGVRVYCLGVSSAGKPPSYWMSLKEFWSSYFANAKVRELKFSMERRLQ